MKTKLEDSVPAIIAISLVLFIASLFVAWVTHVVVCVQESEWLFLIAGAVMVPIAVVHGYGVLMGIW